MSEGFVLYRNISGLRMQWVANAYKNDVRAVEGGVNLTRWSFQKPQQARTEFVTGAIIDSAPVGREEYPDAGYTSEELLKFGQISVWVPAQTF